MKNKFIKTFLITSVLFLIIFGPGIISDSQKSLNLGGTGTINPLPIKSFLGLNDTPDSYSGQGGKALTVKSDASGLEFTTAGGGGTWGSITGTLSAQTDLQGALDLKAPLTTPTFLTNITSPLILGGSSTTSPLTLQTTSGVGTTGANMYFKTGNNGGTEAMTILNSGNVGIGVTSPGGALDVNGTVRANSLATGSGYQPLVSGLYVQSRGENLTTNGSGLMGNNYNFSTMTFDAVETHGGGGSFRINVLQQARFSDELIPVDITKRYRQVAWMKSGDIGGGNFNAANRQYIGVANYDIDGFSIGPEHSTKYAGSTDTTLAAQLNPGDTTVTLTNATGWYNSTSASSQQFSWYGYTNSKGYTYPDYTYTRNHSGNYSSNISLGTWGSGGISGNVITLRVPWAGPTVTAGTAIRNAPYAGTFKYITASSVIVPNTWTRYEGYIGAPAGDSIERDNEFRAGTAYVKWLFLVNYHGAADNNVRYSDMWFSEASAQNFEVATATQQGVVSLTNQSLGTGDKYFNSKVGIGTTSPTAYLNIKAGTSALNTAPLKFTSGTNLTTAETGAMEYDGTNLTFTPTGTLRENVFTGARGSITLTAGTTTTITVSQAKTTSTIIISPTSLGATALTPYVSTKNNGSFVITTLTAAGTETMDYIIVN